MMFDVDHILDQVFQDYIVDEDVMMEYYMVDKMDNNFVALMLKHLIHDHMDMHLQEHNNLYYQKNLYREFYSYLLVMMVMKNQLMNENKNVEYV